MTVELLKLEDGHKVHISTCFIQGAVKAKYKDLTVSALLKHLYSSFSEVTCTVYILQSVFRFCRQSP